MTRTSGSSKAVPAPAHEPLPARIEAELTTLERELAEIDLLLAQVRTEAGRHEQKRAAAAEKLATAAAGSAAAPRDVADLGTQLATMTRRATMMESQVDLLEGKRKALARFHDSLASVREELANGPAEPAVDTSDLPPAVSRVVLAAQEDLRREIARAMHDGPAQSLTNIVLQAQIVERLMAKEPAAAGDEVRQLISMVQQTLDATKSFIFDVRPMVLDDLGLVPTLRRAARDRGRRAGVAVAFESIGADTRLPVEVESALFRILDEALAAYLGAAPEHLSLRLDWGERLDATIGATKGEAVAAAVAAAEAAAPDVGPAGKDVPAALAAMMEERREARRARVETARRSASVTLPEPTWREIQQRAATVGAIVTLNEDGAEMHVSVDVPSPGR